ncbi:MAG TPA: 4a-hydroxytetrahydrobiopterin dehydratase [Longimicrobiales bacterium]|nr:4a-hydroxytetrahydrobiopterin dehydratase [Longimicrobiales bacterium]
MARKLNEESITDWLERHPEWTRDGDKIRKTVQFEKFRDSIVFVNRLATLADDAEHHPDIDIRYDKVIVGLTTHDAGGLTEKDTKLAEKIDHASRTR